MIHVFPVERFADGEVNIMVHDNVRGKDVYLVQPTCACHETRELSCNP